MKRKEKRKKILLTLNIIWVELACWLACFTGKFNTINKRRLDVTFFLWGGVCQIHFSCVWFNDTYLNIPQPLLNFSFSISLGF